VCVCDEQLDSPTHCYKDITTRRAAQQAQLMTWKRNDDDDTPQVESIHISHIHSNGTLNTTNQLKDHAYTNSNED